MRKKKVEWTSRTLPISFFPHEENLVAFIHSLSAIPTNSSIQGLCLLQEYRFVSGDVQVHMPEPPTSKGKRLLTFSRHH